MVFDYCNIEKIKAQQIFDTIVIQKLLKDFYSGKKEYAFKIWYLLSFQMWYDRWI